MANRISEEDDKLAGLILGGIIGSGAGPSGTLIGAIIGALVLDEVRKRR